MSEKRVVWFFSMEPDGEPVMCLGPDRAHAAEMIRQTIESDMELPILGDGEEITYTLKRIDMTQEEEDALPEL